MIGVKPRKLQVHIQTNNLLFQGLVRSQLCQEGIVRIIPLLKEVLQKHLNLGITSTSGWMILDDLLQQVAHFHHD